jgi:cobalt/nickel transport system permease protein
MLGLPLWAAGFLAGLIGDVMVYVASGLILGTTLASAPNPQYSLGGYLLVIYSAYLPTQLPIAIGEALVTGLALHYAGKQRPEILASLGILTRKEVRFSSQLMILSAMIFVWGAGYVTVSEAATPAVVESVVEQSTPDSAPQFSGMDEAVNEMLAEKAGRPPHEPYLNMEDKGDLSNFLLLLAGGICGFTLGRYWHLLWGRPNLASGSAVIHRNSACENTH